MRKPCSRCEVLHFGRKKICIYCELELRGISLPVFEGTRNPDIGFITFAHNNGLQQFTRRIAHNSLADLVDRWHWRTYDVGN